MRTLWQACLATSTAALLIGQLGCAGAERSAATACTGAETPSSRLFLQQVSSTSAIIKWRGDAGVVCIGEDVDRLTVRVEAVDEGHHKWVRVAGLRPDTTYYYSVGGAPRSPQNQRFRTAPRKGELPADGNTRIWLLGDSGTATEFDREGHPEHPGEALAVKQGALDYIAAEGGGEPIDLLLLLGDNAYPAGSDAEWQGAFFDIYPELIRTVSTFPTIGNHEMGIGIIDICPFYQLPDCENGPVDYPQGGASGSSDPDTYDSDGDGADIGGLPYLQIFSLPTRAELGGAPSGTEQYYSIDHGNLHIVSLDSQLSNQDDDQRAAMRDWLVNDLSANTLDWTVVIFHHPPYSKGKNHDSDVEQTEIDMRATFAPVFEDHGVDVVYSGHAHSYERSWYIGGHHGPSNTFDAKRHAELDQSGKPSFGQSKDAYPQISATSGVDDKAVYTVAGSSGKVGDESLKCTGGQTVGCITPDWLQHPAHRTFEKLAEDYHPNGIKRLGSVILDVSADTLTSSFVDHHAKVLDYFIIRK